MSDLRFVSYGDTKCRITFGTNDITKHIKVNDRFIINHDLTYRLVNKVDYEYNGQTTDSDSLISCILLQTPEYFRDDKENNIAHNIFSDKVDEIFLGNDFCYVGENPIFEFISDSQVTFELENINGVLIQSQESNQCVLAIDYNLDLIGKSFTLFVKKNDKIIAEKNVLIRGV